MARLPYADPGSEKTRALVDRIVAERGNVLHLYQMLLHSPPITEGWLQLLSAVRLKSNVSGAIREIVIMRVAHLNRASYEADQHAPIALREGVTQPQLDALKHWDLYRTLYSREQCAALALADRMTLEVQVDDATWSAASEMWSSQELVELVVTVASYNMVSRVLEALQIHSGDARHP